MSLTVRQERNPLDEPHTLNDEKRFLDGLGSWTQEGAFLEASLDYRQFAARRVKLLTNYIQAAILAKPHRWWEGAVNYALELRARAERRVKAG